MADILNKIKDIDLEASDEYDKALVFALKKWIADEINNITDSGVYAAAVCFQTGIDEDGKAGYDVSFAYNTEAFLKEHIGENGEARWNFCAWKEDHFGSIDSDPAVYGSVDIWADFKGYDPENGENEDEACICFMKCAAAAVRQLRADYIFRERFGRDIAVLICGGLEPCENTALYTAAANDISLLDKEFFDMCGII